MFTDPLGSTLTRIHNVADISGPEITVASIDVTSHDSLDAFAESLPGQAEAGEVTFDLMLDAADAGFARLWSLAVDTPAAGGRKVASFYLLLPGVASVIAFGFSGAVAGAGWTSPGTSWVYSSTNPGVSNTLTKALPTGALILGETYVIEFGFAGTPTGSGLVNVKIGSVVIGTINPSAGGVQRVVFDSFFSTVSIVLEVPAALEVPFGFTINKFSVVGIADNQLKRVTFFGAVTKVAISAAQGDALKAAVSVKVSGKPVFVGPTIPG